MRARFAGRRALLAGGGCTGPGMGNGKAAAILYAREGVEVPVVDCHVAGAEETMRLITAEGGRTAAAAGEMTRAHKAVAAVARMAKAVASMRYTSTSAPLSRATWPKLRRRIDAASAT